MITQPVLAPQPEAVALALPPDAIRARGGVHPRTI